MILPTDYISYSNWNLFKNSRSEWIKNYIHGQKWQGNKYTEFGKEIAEALEKGESEDEIISQFLEVFPKYPKREKKAEMVVEIKIGNNKVKLLGKPDGLDDKKDILGEFKTGKKWSQQIADKSKQLIFYHLLYLLKHKKTLKKIWLHWAETTKDGEVELTGNFKTFSVKPHSRLELMKLLVQLKKDIREMSEVYKSEIKKL